jgi:hypothetical protein
MKRTDAGHPLGTHYEIGWRLRKAAQGLGYATQGARRSLIHAWQTLDVAEIVSYASADNQPSAASWRDLHSLGTRPGISPRVTKEATGMDLYGWPKDRPHSALRATDRKIEPGSCEKDYVIWDDEPSGFGLRVFASSKRSYVLQYRVLGRSRRSTIGLHGVWTAESARQEAKVQLGRIA